MLRGGYMHREAVVEGEVDGACSWSGGGRDGHNCACGRMGSVSALPSVLVPCQLVGINCLFEQLQGMSSLLCMVHPPALWSPLCRTHSNAQSSDGYRLAVSFPALLQLSWPDDIAMDNGRAVSESCT